MTTDQPLDPRDADQPTPTEPGPPPAPAAATQRVVVRATAAPTRPAPTPPSPYLSASAAAAAEEQEPSATGAPVTVMTRSDVATPPPAWSTPADTTPPPPTPPVDGVVVEPPPAPRAGLPLRSYLAIALAGALGAAAVVVPDRLADDPAPVEPPVAQAADDGDAASDPTAATDDLPPLPATSDGSLVAAIAQRMTPSVLRIDVASPTGGGSGSGVVLASDGDIMTNAHVVENATEITVLTPDGERLDATLVGLSTSYDIAVIHVEATDLPVPTFADREPTVGDMAVAIGSPFGLDGSVTAGIISGVGRSLSAGGASLIDLIQTDAAINPGNSGGALVNAAGEVVGINTAILSRSGANDGVGFAVPIQTALSVAADLIEFGEVRAGYIGIEGQSVDPEVARLYGLTVEKGAVVVTVVAGTPADEAGLQESDIIVGVDGEPIESMLDLAVLIQRREPGETITLTIVRDDAEQELELTLGTRP